MNEDIELDQEIQDPTEEGIEGLKGINTKQDSDDDYSNVKVISGTRAQLKKAAGFDNNHLPYTRFTLPKDFGKSKYDKEITSTDWLNHLETLRGEKEGAFLKLLNGTGKAGLTAVTTFLSGTVGLAYGIEEAIREGKFSKVWNNEIMDLKDKIDQWGEENMPNYYTESEQNQPWYTPDNLFSANFIGDSFIKNLGFMAGAIWAGGAVGSGLNAVGKLPFFLKLGEKLAPGVAGAVRGIVGSTAEAFNEGGIEAYTNSKETFKPLYEKEFQNLNEGIATLDSTFNLRKQQLDKEFQEDMAKLPLELPGENYKNTKREQRKDQYKRDIDNLIKEYESQVEILKKDYKENKDRLDIERAGMGNTDLILNAAILPIGNYVMYGKLMAGGIGQMRRVAKGLTRGVARTKAVGNVLYQGVEEGLQKIAAAIPADYYLEDYNHFYRTKYDPNYADEAGETIGLAASALASTVKTLKDPDTWEEVTIGALSAAVGLPGLRSVRSSSGKLQSPIYFRDNLFTKLKEAKNQADRAAIIRNYIDNRKNNPKWSAYYAGLTRHLALGQEMQDAVNREDVFDFKNSEFEQLISDITMFDNVGELNSIKELINSTLETSDENIKFLIENTTTKTEDNNLVGPYAEYATINPTTGEIEANISEGDKSALIEDINDRKNRFLKAIKDFRRVKNRLDIETNVALTDDQLEELTWFRLKLDNWRERAIQLSKEIKSVLQNTKDYAFLDTEDAEKDLTRLLGYKDDVFGENIVKNENINNLKNYAKQGITGTEESESSIESKIDDLVKIQNGINSFSNKLNEYLRNPRKQEEDHNKIKENIDNKRKEKEDQNLKNKINTIKESLKNATDLTGFRTVADDPELDANEKNNAINELVNEGHSLASTYKNLLKQRQNARAYLNDKQKKSELDGRTYKDANQLLDYFYDSAKDEEGLSSGIITDEINDNEDSIKNTEGILEPLSDSEKNTINPKDRALNAREALLEALNYKSSTNNMDNPAPTNTQKPTETQEGNQPEGEQGDKSNKGQGNQQDTTKKPTEEGENEDQEQKPEDATEIIEPETDDNVNNENRDSEDNEANRGPINKSNEIISSVPKYSVEERRDHRVLIPLKNANSSFTNIWDYLNDHGAFDYIDEGKLKVDDKVSFMIDPAFEASKGWNSTTIFIVKGDQVIGVLHENPKKVAEYQGLKELRESIEAEYKNHKGDGKFKSKTTTTVNRILNGYVPMGNQQNLNSSFFGEEEPIFAVMKNGQLVTNKTGIRVQKLQNSVGKEGRVYLLIKGANGVYVPYGVRRVTTKDMDLRDTKEGTIQDDIRKALDTLAKYLFKNAEAFKKGATFTGESSALKDLAKTLVLGDFHFQIVENNGNKALLISKKLRDENGKLRRNENGTEEQHEYIKLGTEQTTEVDGVIPPIGGTGVKSNFTSLAENEILTNLITAIKELDMLPQISASSINKGSYNNKIINSEVLNSNISNPKQSGAWFSLNSKQDNGPTRETPKKPVNNNSTKTVDLPNGSQYTIEESNGEFIVKTSDGQVINDTNLISIIKGLSDNPNNYLIKAEKPFVIYDKVKDKFFLLQKDKDAAFEAKDAGYISILRQDFGLEESNKSKKISEAVNNLFDDSGDLDGFPESQESNEKVSQKEIKDTEQKYESAETEIPTDDKIQDYSNLNWESINNEDRSYLEQAGWTEEEFNKLTSDEKEQVLNCAGIK